jgi:hypothetical protein
MRRTFLLLGTVGLLAGSSAAWAGCYHLSSDCTLLLTCGGAGGTATASSSAGSTSATGTGGATSASAGSTSTTGTGGVTSASAGSTSTTGTGGADAGPVCDKDGTQDGTETDVDCGGPACMPCAQGKRCKASSDCATGATCVESVCCGSPSCAPCHSCAIPGSEGTCTDLPKGTEEPMTCESAGICDVGGTCTGVPDGGASRAFRAACTAASDCFNGVCQAGFCRLALGDPCGSDVACGSGLCAGNVCAACTTDANCVSTHCNAGVCALAGGAPCAANVDCGSQFCDSLKFCIASGSETCTPANCIDHFCGSSSQCQSCSTASDCPLHTPCTGGQCLAPSGAFCNQGSECASGTCGPAALLDFARCQ